MGSKGKNVRTILKEDGYFSDAECGVEIKS